MTPVITPGTSDTDSSYPADYKSNIDIDMHKPMNPIDTDYRPNYDGKSIFIRFYIYLKKYIMLNKCISYYLDLSHNKTNEIPSYDSNISYDDLRARNRFEFERTQPNKPVYR